jgi:polar amino acid transport system substrate-binding protein
LASGSLAEVSTAGTLKEIPIYTYHTHPPFIIDTDKGLSYDLADYLSAKSEGRFKFVVKPMSRPKVNKMIEQAKDGIVPWVNPVWFKDKEETKHMWSGGFLMEDGNAIISHIDLQLIYEGPQSLDGLVFGGIKAHVYAGIDDYIKNTGRLKRVDTENHVDNFRKLRKRRIDVTLTPKSGADYLIKRESLQNTLFISPKLQSSYKRRVIIISKQPSMLTFIDSALADPSWHGIIQRYQ